MFDAENYHVMPPNSSRIAVRADLSTDKIWNTPGTSQERSPESFPQTGEVCDVTDTYPYMESDAGISSEQPNPRAKNPAVWITKHVKIQNLIAMTFLDINSWAALMCFEECICRLSKHSKSVLRNRHVAISMFVIFC